MVKNQKTKTTACDHVSSWISGVAEDFGVGGLHLLSYRSLVSIASVFHTKNYDYKALPELMQAILLTCEKLPLDEPLNIERADRNFQPYDVEKFLRSLVTCLGVLSEGKGLDYQADLQALQARIDKGLSRGFVHPDRVAGIYGDILSRLDDRDVVVAFGVGGREVVDLIRTIVTLLMDKSFNFQNKNREPNPEAFPYRELTNSFSFSLDEISEKLKTDKDSETITNLLDHLSFPPGDLREQDLTGLILDNPVNKKPLIKLNANEYFCANFHTIPNHLPDIIDGLIGGQGSLLEKYSKSKAGYLEDRVGEILVSRFPRAKVIPNLEWTDLDSGKEYEIDQLLLGDSFAIVVEAKSGKFSETARRGADESIGKYVRNLVVKSSEQIAKFTRAAKAGRIGSCQSRGKPINLDLTDVRYYVPLSVILDEPDWSFLSIKGIFKSGKNAGLKPMEMAHCISLADFEGVVSLLDSEPILLDYLINKRRELSTSMDFMPRGEISMLDYYFRGISHSPNPNADSVITVDTIDGNLDKYLSLDRYESPNVEPPKIKWITNEARLVLNHLADTRHSYWLEASFWLIGLCRKCRETPDQSFPGLLRGIVARYSGRELGADYHQMAFKSSYCRVKMTVVVFFYSPSGNSGDQDNRRLQIITAIFSDKRLAGLKKFLFAVDLTTNEFICLHNRECQKAIFRLKTGP